MKILVLSHDVWSNEKPFGNTLSNWFGGTEWKEDRFQCVFARAEIPNNGISERSYRITVTNILRNVIKPERMGEIIESPEADHGEKKDGIKKVSNERKAIDTFKKIRSKTIHEATYFIVESIYHSKIWINDKFRTFIDDFSPDIVFSYLADDGFVKPIIEYISETTKAKLVLIASDDVYGHSQKTFRIRRRRIEKNLRWLVQKADYLFAQSEDLCDYYKGVFGKSFHVLYKGCELDFAIEEKNNKPMRIVYAGNLLYGRNQTLCELAEALKKVNENSIKALLEIYTTSPLQADDALLNDPLCSSVKGSKPYSEIMRIMRESDIVLYVESFDREQVDHVKYSFSTKIIDCLQSGAVALAIGPAGSASIEYFKKIEGGMVVTDIHDIEKAVRQLMDNQDLYERAELIHRFARENHEIHTVRKDLRNTFVQLLGE